jgi:putative tricarboxylic transport membrane protein
VASNDLPGMRGFAFGPGTAPRLFAFTLAIMALGVVIGGLLTQGPQISGYKLRGVIFIIGAILSFAATIRPLGLVIASFATMVICAAAADDVKWRETLIVAICVTAFCSVLFPYGLNLPFQLWPRFW